MMQTSTVTSAGLRSKTMRIWVAALVLTQTGTGCALMTVKQPGLPPRLELHKCTQSNWAAGVDLVLAAGAGTTAVVFANQREFDGTERTSTAIAGAAALASGTAIASMVYGFRQTGKCRIMREHRGLASEGGYHWLIAPGSIVVIAGIVVLALSRGGTVDPDRCLAGDYVTALCMDGYRSCSLNRRGTCSWHGGVDVWYGHR